MIRNLGALLFIVLGIHLNAQYDYFNIHWNEEPSYEGSSSLNIFSSDTGYVCLAGIATVQGDNYVTRSIGLEGNVFSQNEISATTRRFSYNPDTYIQLSNGEYQVLESIYMSVENASSASCAIAHWDADLNYLFTDTLAITNIDTLANLFSSMLMVDDTSFCIAGTQSYNYEGPVWPVLIDSTARFLWKVHTNGNIIWKKKLFSTIQNSSYTFNFMLPLANGEMLLSTSEFTDEVTDHQLIKTNAEGNVLATYQWGHPDYPEARAKGVKLPNGHIVIFYLYDNYFGYNQDNVMEFDLDLHFMKFDPQSMLPVPDSDVLVENEFTDEYVRNCVCQDILSCPDGGYLVLMNFSFLNVSYWIKPVMLKVNADFEMEWMRDYIPTSIETYQSNLYDVECAPDGGYIATGDCFTTGANTQRHWVLKIDACGDIEDLGCYVGIEEPEVAKERILAYPNPAQEFIVVQAVEQAITSIRLMDVSGKILKIVQYNNQSPQQVLDIMKLAAGSYQLEVTTTDNQKQMLQIVKQ